MSRQPFSSLCDAEALVPLWREPQKAALMLDLSTQDPALPSCRGAHQRPFGWTDFIRNWAVMYFSLLSRHPHGEWESVPAPNRYHLCVQLSTLPFPRL